MLDFAIFGVLANGPDQRLLTIGEIYYHIATVALKGGLSMIPTLARSRCVLWGVHEKGPGFSGAFVRCLGFLSPSGRAGYPLRVWRVLGGFWWAYCA